MGTVPYMSPEQVAGRPVDHRTDIFSLGVILYEMAGGLRPFHGTSSAELASAILRDTPPSICQVRADLPQNLGRVIERCLEKSAADRFASSRDLADRLRGVTADSPVSSTVKATDSGSGSARANEGFWVAVLRFKYTGAHADLSALAEGLSEEIVTGLSRFSYLRVIARGSTSWQASEMADVRAVGTELGAR
jgi:eukaryotic-like serine/threonine-protein kinase